MAQTLNPSMTRPLMQDDTRHLTMALPNERRIFAQAYQVLHIAFVVAPLIAGIDKFFNRLTVWENYLAPVATQITGWPATTFMHVVGAIEILAAIGVMLKPKIFAYVVCAWLAGIIVNLLMLGDFYDVALRDLGLALAAFALARLALIYESRSQEEK